MAGVRLTFAAFLFLLLSSFVYLRGVFNKTIIPLALVGREMIKPTWHYAPRRLVYQPSHFLRALVE